MGVVFPVFSPVNNECKIFSTVRVSNCLVVSSLRINTPPRNYERKFET